MIKGSVLQKDITFPNFYDKVTEPNIYEESLIKLPEKKKRKQKKTGKAITKLLETLMPFFCNWYNEAGKNQ